MIERLIILDDEEGFDFLFQHHFEPILSKGVEYYFFTSLEDSRECLIKTAKRTAFVCDLHIDEQCGLDFSRKMKEYNPALEIVIISGRELKDCEFKFFNKPVDFKAMREYLEKI